MGRFSGGCKITKFEDIQRGRRAISLARAKGMDTNAWEQYLSNLERELAAETLIEGQPPEWHAQEIARLVQIEGQAIFWATLFNEVIAFVKDESYRALIPSGIVIYSMEEIEKLFGSSSYPPKEILLRIHKEKKLLNARLIDYQKPDTGNRDKG